jgi:hypothetical protein
VWERWWSGGLRLSPQDAAELESRLGYPRWIRRLPSSSRSEVWLAEFDGSPAVVKQILGASPGAGEETRLGREARERYSREVTALRLAARTHPAVVPTVLATLPAARLLVLERLNGRGPGTGWTVPWAVALARLHASTGPADAGTLPAWRPPGLPEARAFLQVATTMEVPVPSSVPGELEQLLVRLHRAGGHDLLHGDPRPGHDLYAGGAVRFLDLEAAALGDGLIELSYLRVGFPSGRAAPGTAGAELLAAESAYRQAYRSAAGTEPAGDLAAACVGWLISGAARAERAGRLAHRLTVVAGLGAVRDDLGGLGRLCLAMRARMNDPRAGGAARPRLRRRPGRAAPAPPTEKWFGGDVGGP